MKKQRLILVILMAPALFLAGFSPKYGEKIMKIPDNIKAYVSAVETLTAISNRDYGILSKYAHSKKGIVFSPDCYVSYEEDSTFLPEEIEKFYAGNVHYWGYYDASDIPLNLTADEYFELYVYNKDYLHCKNIGINVVLGVGNGVENVAEAFPESIFIEFYDEGTEFYEGLDWGSLKLVLVKENGRYKVVAIINSGYVL